MYNGVSGIRIFYLILKFGTAYTGSPQRQEQVSMELAIFAGYEFKVHASHNKVTPHNYEDTPL